MGREIVAASATSLEDYLPSKHQLIMGIACVFGGICGLFIYREGHANEPWTLLSYIAASLVIFVVARLCYWLAYMECKRRNLIPPPRPTPLKYSPGTGMPFSMSNSWPKVGERVLLYRMVSHEDFFCPRVILTGERDGDAQTLIHVEVPHHGYPIAFFATTETLRAIAHASDKWFAAVAEAKGCSPENSEAEAHASMANGVSVTH